MKTEPTRGRGSFPEPDRWHGLSAGASQGRLGSNTEKKVTFKGTVTKLDWKNPHVFTYIDVVDESGKVTNWAIEGSTPNQLYRAGWRKTDLKPGDTVTVTDSSPARNGTAKSYGGIVTLPDGRRVLGGSAATDR